MRHAAIATVTAFLALAVAAPDGAAQGNKAVAGTYALVTANNVDTTTGAITPMYGPNPKGQMVLTPEGRYSVIIVRPDVPKFTSKLRTKGTPAENEAAVAGGLAHFGTYTVGAGGRVLVFQAEASTYPNWSPIRLNRPFAAAGDMIKIRATSASGGGAADITWKKTK